MRSVTRMTFTSALLVFASGAAHAVPFGGIEFPDGEISFADRVVSFSPGPDVGPGYDDPTLALGTPDGDHLSLGDGGEVILEFTNNSLTTSGDATPDLHVFEVGAVVESFNLAISVDGLSWIDLGTLSGQPTSVDIDGIVGVTSGEFYSFVRIGDAPGNQTNYPFGEADIDAVGAIASAPPVEPPPTTKVFEPGTFALLGAGLLGLGVTRRRQASRGRRAL